MSAEKPQMDEAREWAERTGAALKRAERTALAREGCWMATETIDFLASAVEPLLRERDQWEKYAKLVEARCAEEHEWLDQVWKLADALEDAITDERHGADANSSCRLCSALAAYSEAKGKAGR